MLTRIAVNDRRRCSRSGRAGKGRDPTSALAVVTVLEPAIRGRFDAAMEGSFASVHVDSVGEAVRAVREHSPTTLVLSPTAVRRESVTAIAGLVARSPGVTSVALLAESKPDDGLLTLGSCGVTRLVDLRDQQGWERLRVLAENPGGEATTVILDAVIDALDGATDEVRQLFGTLVRCAPVVTTTKDLAVAVRMHHSTITSRFFRHGLPTPKKYLGMMRLVYASAFLGLPKASVTDVAYKLQFSSPQSFGRTVRAMLGLTASEFRREYCFSAVLDHFITRLIAPYRETFKSFYPLDRVATTAAMSELAR